MKILQVHKYFNRKRGGGSVTALLEIVKLFSKKGHEISIFSMQDENNAHSPFEKYFTSHFDLNEKINLVSRLKQSLKIIYNFEARKKMGELLRDIKPKIVHLHNIYHYLSPSIIGIIKKNKIPIVMTAHDYKIICPNYKLFVRGKICEKCKGGKYYNCVRNRCLKNSLSASLVAAVEAYVHKFLKSYAKIDLFIAPSLFMKNKLVEFGIPEQKIRQISNPIDSDGIKRNISDMNSPGEESYFLYYGRLSEEKGLADLIRATAKLEEDGILGENNLHIVGHGPEEENLKKLTTELGMENKIKFLGFKLGKELLNAICRSKFVVIPSIWYDNSPMVAIESQLCKKPLIVSDLGGTRELILEGETGLVFEAGNTSDLADKIKKMLALTKEERTLMGQRGMENISRINDNEKIYQAVLETYNYLLK
jgi:glycosyltransferase involved in cell wall biosynthesis